MEEFAIFRERLIEGFKYHSAQFERILETQSGELEALKQQLEDCNTNRLQLESENSRLRLQIDELKRRSGDGCRLAKDGDHQAVQPRETVTNESTEGTTTEVELRAQIEQKNYEYAKLVKSHNIVLDKFRDLRAVFQQLSPNSSAQRSAGVNLPNKSSEVTGAPSSDDGASALVALESPTAPVAKYACSKGRALSNSANSVLLPPQETGSALQDAEIMSRTIESGSSGPQEVVSAAAIVQCKSPTSLDEPVVVSERSLKRKRATPRAGTTTSAHRIDNELAGELITVKAEPGSSPPSHWLATQGFAHDTLELDEVSLPLVPLSSSEASNSQEHGNKRRKTMSMSSPQINAQEQKLQAPRCPAPMHQILDDISRVIQKTDGLLELSRVRAPGNPSALQAKTPNARILPSKSSMCNEIETSSKIQSLAEDAENYFPDREALPMNEQNSLIAKCRPRRSDDTYIHGLLPAIEDRFPVLKNPRERLGNANDHKSSNASRACKVKPLLTPYQAMPTGKGPDHMGAGTGVERTPRRVDAPLKSRIQKAGARSTGRLRDRDPTLLRPEDFKINPASNKNLNYAYSEVVRKSKERKCLPNCKKPSCCGSKLEKAVQIGGLFAGTSENIDKELLAQYLGPDWSKRLSRMSKSERQYNLNKARAEAFSNRYGRHRNAHERPPSPPGFWRTEMPTTQEGLEDRERAMELEREKVEERRREALRPNGRWMFVDE